IPNRTVKRLRANDSAATSVKVGHRQAFIPHSPVQEIDRGFCFCSTTCTLTFICCLLLLLFFLFLFLFLFFFPCH
ncbi:hypothetical protein, partial [Undibacterium sp. RuTC16W]|uniref:hypothetical protein n=1 Tax=Undibacterium sp. RuTC16W TaxID=3413048 RepID=UPI003BF06091